MIRVILSTGSLYLYDLSLVFEMTAEAGYDGIEIMCDNRYTTREPDYLCGLSATYGLPIPVVHNPFYKHLPGWGNADTELGRLRHSLKLAERVDAERIVVHLPMKYGRGAISFGNRKIQYPWFSEFADFKRWMDSGGLKEMQANTRLELAVENMPAKHFMGAPRNIAWWNSITEWSRIHDYLTLDTTHWGTFGINPIEPLRAAGARVRHIHLSNYDGREHRLPHEGQQDLAAFLREVAAMNFTGTVSVEVAPDALAFDNPKAARRKLRETLGFCREHLN